MAKGTTTERERFILFQLISAQQPANRMERKRNDRIWDALNLDSVASKNTQPPPRVETLDGEVTSDYDITSEQRDFLIDLLDKPGLTQQGARWLRRFDEELVKGRDG
jgi:hypothetical protein